MRRRYDTQLQRMIFTPSRPSKRSREEIAEIAAELTQRANQIGGGYLPMQAEEEEEEPEAPEEGELQAEQTTVDTEEDSVIMRGDKLTIVDLSKYTNQEQPRCYRMRRYFGGRKCGKILNKK